MKKFFLLHSECWLVLAVIFIAGWLRFWHLDTLPAALNRDEAALGYNAWLLAETGTDEWGESWPIALKSFGDYKLPGYPILTKFSFDLFGRSDWSVRYPSALAGTLLPLAVWCLAKQIGWTKWHRVAASIIVAVLPFSIFYSRMAFEANVALTLVITGLACFIAGLQAIKWQTTAWSFGWGLICWTVGIFTYNTPLLLTPFVIVGLLLWYRGEYLKKTLLLSFLLGLLMSVSVASLWQLSQQKSGITIFSDPTIESQIIERYLSLDGWQQKVFGSRFVVYSTKIVNNFVSSLTPQFLVTHGGSHPWHTIPQTAHLTWFIYLFGLFGLVNQISLAFSSFWHKNQNTTQSALNFLAWLTLASLAPAVVTVDAPHATRSLLSMLLLSIFAIPGSAFIYTRLPASKIIKNALLIFFIGFALHGAVQYIYTYFWQYPKTQAVFQPGLAQLLPTLKNHQKPIIVAGDGYTYILLAWYQPIAPADFLRTIERHPVDTIGFAAGKKVGTYTIRPDFKTPEATTASLLEWTGQTWLLRE